MEVDWQREEWRDGQCAFNGAIYKMRVSAGPKTMYRMKNH
jgi:hypothetical protein